MQNFEERLRTCVRQEGRHLSDVIFRNWVINVSNQNCIYYRLFWCWHNFFILKINKVTIIWGTCVLFAPPGININTRFSHIWELLKCSHSLYSITVLNSDGFAPPLPPPRVWGFHIILPLRITQLPARPAQAVHKRCIAAENTDETRHYTIYYTCVAACDRCQQQSVRQATSIWLHEAVRPLKWISREGTFFCHFTQRPFHFWCLPNYSLQTKLSLSPSLRPNVIRTSVNTTTRVLDLETTLQHPKNVHSASSLWITSLALLRAH